MPDKFNNDDFEKHIKTLIINKEIYKMLEQLRSIMRKIVFILGEENWVENNFSNYQKKQSLGFIIDYSFIYCVNELTVVLNDSGTLAPMAGIKKWKGEYDSKYLEFFFKTAFQLDELGWNKLNNRWAYFFIFLAILNELVWRTQPETTWVNFKVWGILPLTFIFTALQLPMINKHKI